MKEKVVITGGTGFIGSNLIDYLLKKEFEVYVIVRPNSNHSNIKIQSKSFYLFQYDNDLSNLIDFLIKLKPTCVFHLASFFVAEHKPNQIDDLVSSNISFGLHLLEAMKEANIKLLINTGTVWQHRNTIDYDPTCLYAATKQAFEDLIDYYVKVENFKAITLKLHDTYGENDHRSKLINILLLNSSKNLETQMSPGEQFVNFIHVEDVCRAFEHAFNLLNQTEVSSHKKYTLRHPKSYKLKDLVKKLEKIINKKFDILWGHKPYRNIELMEINNDLELLPGFTSFISLEEGFSRLNKVV